MVSWTQLSAPELGLLGPWLLGIYSLAGIPSSADPCKQRPETVTGNRRNPSGHLVEGHTPARRDRSGARGSSKEGCWKERARHTDQHTLTSTRGVVLFCFQNILARNKEQIKVCLKGRSISRRLKLSQPDLTATSRASKAPRPMTPSAEAGAPGGCAHVP